MPSLRSSLDLEMGAGKSRKVGYVTGHLMHAPLAEVDVCSTCVGSRSHCKNPIRPHYMLSNARSKRWQKLGNYRKTCPFAVFAPDRQLSSFANSRLFLVVLSRPLDKGICVLEVRVVVLWAPRENGVRIAQAVLEP